MCRRRKPRRETEAERANREMLARLGRELRASRLRRDRTQAELAEMVGMSQSTISHFETGKGGSFSLDAWQRVSTAVDRTFTAELGRDAREEPADAGHLAIQELVLRIGRAAGYDGTFELPGMRPGSNRSTDVGLRRPGRLVLVECVNTFGDVGAAMRSSDRKRRDAEEVAIALGGESGLAIHTCWVVRATQRNRELVARYSELFAARFPASSSAWVAALTGGTPPPEQPGLIWCDVAATRLMSWQRPR